MKVPRGSVCLRAPFTYPAGANLTPAPVARSGAKLLDRHDGPPELVDHVFKLALATPRKGTGATGSPSLACEVVRTARPSWITLPGAQLSCGRISGETGRARLAGLPIPRAQPHAPGFPGA